MSAVARPLSTALALAAALLAPAAALAGADVAVRTVTAPPDATVGFPVPITVTLENIGSVRLTGYTLGVYLSPDSHITVWDRKVGEAEGPELEPGEKLTLELHGTIGEAVAPGSYSIGVVADPVNALGEPASLLLDNVKASAQQTSVKVPSPDFVAKSLAWGSRQAGGEVVPVKLVVENRGVRPGEARAGFFLSTNDLVTRTDQQVGQQRLALGAGELQEFVAWVALPPGLAPARYYLGVWVDLDEEVAELREDNNRAVSAPADVISASLALETTYLPDALVGIPYVRALVASGGDGPYRWRLADGALPAGLVLSEAGLVTGTPSEAGTASPVVEVTSGGRTASAALILRAYAPTTPLQVATEYLPPAVVGVDYEAPLAASGGTPPYTWRHTAGTLPAGLQVTADGRVKGRAGAEIVGSFTVEVRDVSGTASRKVLSIRTLASGGLAIDELVLPDGVSRQAYLAKLLPLGGAAPFQWALASGRLPEGLALAGEGNALVVSGKPQQTGAFVFSLRLEDSTGQADRNTYVLRVAPSPITIVTTSLPDVARGSPYEEELTSSASDGVWRVASGELPPGVELSPGGRVRATTGTVPATAPLRTYSFLAEVTDADGGVGRVGLSITVVPVPTEPADTGGCAHASPAALALAALALLLVRRRRAAATLLALLSLAAPARAQNAKEYFARTTSEETYPALVDATTLGMGGETDTGDTELTLPFAFSFFGDTFTSAKVGIDGYLSFNGDGEEYDNQQLPNASSPNAVLAPWWDDLQMKKPATAGEPSPTAIRWKVEGTAPERVVAVEWSRVTHFRADATTGGEFSFQVRLSETGALSFHYDRPAPGTGAPPFTATVGVEDAQGGEGMMVLGCSDHCAAADFPGGTRIDFERHVDVVPASINGPGLAWGNIPASFDISFRNQGSLPATGVVGRLHLSADRQFDPEQDAMLVEVNVSTLTRGEVKSFANNTVTLPDLAPGLYYPFLVLDPDDAVAESNEANNVKIGDPVRVGLPAPDFHVVSISLGAASAAPGAVVTATIVLGNRGNREGEAPWLVVASLNDVLSLADRPLASGAIALAAGETGTATAELSLPEDLQPGLYRLGVLVDASTDPALQTLEIDEFNNAGRATDPLLVSTGVAIATETLPNATAGAAYSVRLRSAGGDGLELWSLASGSRLPAGLALSPRGSIEGVPTSTGAFPFTVKLTSNGTETAQREFTLQVDAPNLLLNFVTAQLPAAIFGREYETRLVASGGAAPYRFRLAAGAASGLPQGLALDANGVLGGVPAAGGAYELELEVVDRLEKVARRSLALHVLPPGRPVIDAHPLEDALVGLGYEAQLSAVGGRAPYAWALQKVRRMGTLLGEETSTLDKPPGLALTADGKLTGTPRELGLYALSIQVTDAGGATDRDTLLLEVRAERGIAILTTVMPSAEAGRDYDESIVATGGDGTLAFSLFDTSQILPDGLTLRADGRIQGRPGAPGRRTFLVRVQDDAHRVDVRALALEVRAPRAPPDAGGCASTGGAGLAALLLALAFVAAARRRSAAAPGLAIALALAAGACTEEPPPPSPCDGVLCQPGETCDPEDGTCRCGGLGGRACTLAEACDAETLTCKLLDRCALVQCTRGMACDGADGLCRCGTAACGEGELCDSAQRRCVTADLCARVTCTPGLACDPADGECKCGGAGGVLCGTDERCVEGICRTDPCASVTCTGGTVCDPEDRRCKCGGTGGELCLYGQTCLPSQGRCDSSPRCASVHCGGGTSCDPADGLCRCGGAGGAVCASGQTCDLATGECVGGNRCFGRTCPTGSECDPEDGLCHCGAGGPVCGDGQSCEVTATQKTCRTVCDPVAQTPCGAGESCTYNATTKKSFCGTAGTRTEGQTCSASTDCGRGLHCVQSLSGSGTCRAYCARPSGTCSAANRTCRSFSGATADLGVCN